MCNSNLVCELYNLSLGWWANPQNTSYMWHVAATVGCWKTMADLYSFPGRNQLLWVPTKTYMIPCYLYLLETPQPETLTRYFCWNLWFKNFCNISILGGRNIFFVKTGPPMIRSVPQNIFDDVVGCRITSFMESLSECEVALDLVEGFSAVKYRNFNHFTIWHLFTVRNSWQTISSLSLQTKHLQVKSIFQKIAPFPGCIFLKWPHFKKNTIPFVWKTYPLLGLSDTWIRMSDTKKLRWILQLLVVSRQLSVILKIWSFWGGGGGFRIWKTSAYWLLDFLQHVHVGRKENLQYKIWESFIANWFSVKPW